MSDIQLLTLTTSNSDLNRVQANVADAFRRLEDQIAGDITTLNTTLYNSVQTNVTNLFQDSVGVVIEGTATSVAPVNVITWTPATGSIENCNVYVQAIAPVGSSYAALNLLLAVHHVQSETFLRLTGSAASLAARFNAAAFAITQVISGASVSIQCTGNGVQAVTWHCKVVRQIWGPL